MLTSDEVWDLMKRAGATLRAMPGGGISLQLSSVAMDMLDDPRESYGYTPVVINKTPPAAADISLMDLVLPWLAYVPEEKILIRKIVAHRMLWNTDRDISTWPYRKLGQKLRCNHLALKRWENEGVRIISEGVNKNKTLLGKIGLYARGGTGAYSGYSGRSGSATLGDPH